MLHGYSTLKVLENVSEAQVDEKIIPAIATWTFHWSRTTTEADPGDTEAAKVSWDLKTRRAVEDVPLPKGAEALRSPPFQQYKLRFSADEDAVEQWLAIWSVNSIALHQAR